MSSSSLALKRFTQTCGWTITLLAIYGSIITTVMARSASTSSSTTATTASVAQPVSLLPAVTSQSTASSVAQSYRSHQQPASSADEAKGSVVESSIWDELGFVYNTYQQCSDVDMSVCLKLKLVNALNGAARSVQTLEPVEGIRFVSLSKESTDLPASRVLSDQELLASLPRSVEGQESALSTMIWDRIAAFFHTHTVQIKFPTADELQKRAASSTDASAEGRDKDKKHHGYIMIPLLLGSTIIPIAYGALALLAGKALIVSKLALVLASIIGIKKLVSHHDGGGGSRRIGDSTEPAASPAEWAAARAFALPHSLQQS